MRCLCGCVRVCTMLWGCSLDWPNPYCYNQACLSACPQVMVDVMLVSGCLPLVSLFRAPIVKAPIDLTLVQLKKKKKDKPPPAPFTTISLSPLLPLLFPTFWNLAVLCLFLTTGFHFCLFRNSHWMLRYPEEMTFKLVI